MLRGFIRGPLEVYSVAVLLYLFSAWLHFPYGGGHIYSDLVSVFQVRECPSGCTLPIPYVQTFVEYPVIVSMFMYAMGLLGRLISSSNILDAYYLCTCAFLLIPTLLLIRESVKITKLLGVDEGRVMRYIIVTPSFLIMLLLNWYVIGVFFSTFALRKYLQGSRWVSGVLLGLSAASNLVTALPAIGMTLSSKGLREQAKFVAGGLASYGLVNAPFVLLNPSLWFSPWQYAYNWYIEGSWMLAFLNLYSPLRHPLSTATFVLEVALILWTIGKTGIRDTVKLSWIFTFAFLFSTYIFTPQMNMILLPFFVFAPIAKQYVEFLVFDLVNALVIVLGYSQALFVFGISYAFPGSLILYMVIVRSLWMGKFTIFDGVWRMLREGRRVS